ERRRSLQAGRQTGKGGPDGRSAPLGVRSSMFDIGWGELLVIGVVALIAIGPKELPGVLRSVGHWMGKIRRMAAEFQGQFQEAMREAEMADLKKHADDLSNSAKSLTSSLTSGLDPSDIMRDVNTETKSAEALP